MSMKNSDSRWEDSSWIFSESLPFAKFSLGMLDREWPVAARFISFRDRGWMAIAEMTFTNLNSCRSNFETWVHPFDIRRLDSFNSHDKVSKTLANLYSLLTKILSHTFAFENLPIVINAATRRKNTRTLLKWVGSFRSLPGAGNR